MMTWVACTESLPESDRTVLIYSPVADDPVWMGYHDGEQWYCIDAFPAKVSHWADLPEPPEGAP